MQRGKKPLFVWKAVPPSKDFVALGMVMTTDNKEPDPDVIRFGKTTLD